MIQRCFNIVYCCDEALCPSWFSALLSIFFRDSNEDITQNMIKFIKHSDLQSSIDIYNKTNNYKEHVKL